MVAVLALVACPKPPPKPDETVIKPEVEVEEMPPLDQLLVRGLRQHDARELDAARKTVQNILVMHPKHLEARVLLAMVAEAAQDAKEAAEAWVEVERILVYRGKLIPFELQPTLYSAARYYVEADRMGRARLFLDELWRRFPTGDWSVKAQLMLAETEAARKRWTLVVKACAVLNRLRPSHHALAKCRKLTLAAQRMLEVGPRPGPAAHSWVWEHPLPQGNPLNDVWIAPDGSLFAVGVAGTILHQGRRRKLVRQESHTRWTLNAIWGSAPDNVYTVGAAGVVLAYDGKKWRVVRPPKPTESDLYGVFTAKPGHMVAVGDRGAVVRIENGRAVAERPASGVLRSVWGPSADRLYAVGEGGLLLLFSDGRWRSIKSDSYEDLWSVWGASASEVFVVGNRKTVVRIDGEKAKELVVGRGHFRDTWGFSGKTVWAVGTRGEVVHFNGRSWTNEPTGCLVDLFGVAGRNKRDLWAVGDGGTLLRRRGRKWSAIAGGLQQELVAITVGPAAGEGHALGKRGMLLHRRRGRWRQEGSLPLLGTYRDMWGNGRRLLAVGDRGLMVRRSGKTWKRVKTDTPEDLLAVWGYDGGATAVGTRGTIVRLVGDKVVLDRPPTGLDLRAVWGDAGVVFAVGNRGTMLKFDGERWRELSTNVLADLHGVWGLSPRSVFAVGEGGLILHWKNGRVTRHSSPISQTLLDVWGSSADAMFAVTRQGAIIRYDGRSWQVERSPAACLTAVAGSPATGVLAVGCHGTVVRWNP
jgi:photosystem II stability/assembly factor-like uncharacterized protein